MRLIIFKPAFVALAMLICFSSCAQKVSHQDALNYCVTVQQHVADSKKAHDTSLGEIKIQMQNAELTATKKIDKIIVDTLRKHFAIYIKGLDQNIETLMSLGETDTEIDFKNKTLVYLNALKKLELMSMPQVFDLLQNGLNTRAAKEKENNEIYFPLRAAANSSNAESQQAFLDYLKKYSIKDEELKPFGLAN